MKASKFYLIKEIAGDTRFHRKTGEFNVPGVYFWGFTLNETASLPKNKNELVIYYIGKDTKSVVRRMMEEITQLIFGGYGTIINHNWLVEKPHSAAIYEKQESDKKGKGELDHDVLYKSKGLHVLYDFFADKNIQETISWMRERLIFSWIEVNDMNEINPLELEMHEHVKTNILGLKGRVNFPNNNQFERIDWSENEVLKSWLIEVKESSMMK